jgi:hypothetical protein
VKEYRLLLSTTQDIIDTLSHFRVTLAEEVRSKSDTVALLQQIDANILDICDRIYLSFYCPSPYPLRLLTSSISGFVTTAVPCSGTIPHT